MFMLVGLVQYSSLFILVSRCHDQDPPKYLLLPRASSSQGPGLLLQEKLCPGWLVMPLTRTSTCLETSTVPGVVYLFFSKTLSSLRSVFFKVDFVRSFFMGIRIKYSGNENG